MPFHDVRIHVRYKLFALWTSLLFFYLYGDYFELYQPGKLQGMLSGQLALGPVSQGVLLGMSSIMVLPSLMPLLSLILPAPLCRWASIVVGILYTVVMILAVRGSWHFYLFYGILEIALTLLAVFYAWTWPHEPHNAPHPRGNY